MKWMMYTDGASRGNPGEAGAGALLVSAGGKEIPLSRYLGTKTNNQAEYAALLMGLEELKKQKAGEVEIRADSELMVRQLKGEYRVKNEGLIPYYEKAKNLLKSFEKVSFCHVPREENKEADKLANEAIDFKDVLSH
ncbi:MAG: ribonuclease HI family protein [Deltaproteobacteria bacterium]|nr:ribonuclease HI family protein [Deltaproteobacteria bacterium]